MSAVRTRLPVDGLFLLDKSSGWSSNQALKKAQYLLNADKAGHCGTLDPLATGLLPIMLGEATKFAQDLLDADKTYLADIRLGVTTDTGDAEGQVLISREVKVDQVQWEAALARFRGEIEQTPPMYSALKHQGKPLYRYAREGKAIERAPRRVRIHELETVAMPRESSSAQLRVRCSKGTYVRTLAEDIGAVLGCGAHLSGLRREHIADLNVADAITIEALMALTPPARLARVRPLDTLMRQLPPRTIDADQARRFLLGQRIRLSAPGDGNAAVQVRVYNQNESSAHLLGLATLDDGLLSPLRVMNQHRKESERL